MTTKTVKFNSLANTTAKQKEILQRMHLSNKACWDLFDFPGTSPDVLDQLKRRYEAIDGNHRDGFTISRIGANFAAKL